MNRAAKERAVRWRRRSRRAGELGAYALGVVQMLDPNIALLLHSVLSGFFGAFGGE